MPPARSSSARAPSSAPASADQLVAGNDVAPDAFDLDLGVEPPDDQAADLAQLEQIAAGYRTGDIFRAGDPRVRKVSTCEMGDAIAGAI